MENDNAKFKDIKFKVTSLYARGAGMAILTKYKNVL